MDETAGRLHAVPGLRGPQIVKRAVDVFLSSVLILLASPVCLVLLLLVTISVSGTPIYRQSRRGRGGRTFTILKFRTLAGPLADIDRPHSEHAFKFTNGDATTRLGRALRRSSLDELPQLVNVLLGDMSLVGPRPFSAPVYTRPDLAGPDRDRWMEIRESVSPGMTGLWQINGRGDLTAAELIRLDLKYVEEWSLWTDLVILLRTLPAVVTMRGAY